VWIIYVLTHPVPGIISAPRDIELSMGDQKLLKSKISDFKYGYILLARDWRSGMITITMVLTVSWQTRVILLVWKHVFGIKVIGGF